jgi:8-oxo-dGTP pyrophosphatase MutT (NUDIX family)
MDKKDDSHHNNKKHDDNKRNRVVKVSATVAAIIERDGRFLVVEESDKQDGRRVLNQPAGHVEPGESLIAAAIREVAEEAGLPFTPDAVVGVYRLTARNGRDYLRICFAGTVPPEAVAQPCDGDIHACHWLTLPEIIAFGPRSSLVLQCIQDYQAGQRLPLTAFSVYKSDD